MLILMTSIRLHFCGLSGYQTISLGAITQDLLMLFAVDDDHSFRELANSWQIWNLLFMFYGKVVHY